MVYFTSFLLDGSGDLRVPHVHILHMIGLSSLVCEGFYAWLYRYICMSCTYAWVLLMHCALSMYIRVVHICFEYVLLMFHYCECTVVMSLRLWI